MIPLSILRIVRFVSRNSKDIRRDGLSAIARKLRRLPGTLRRARLAAGLSLLGGLTGLFVEVMSTRSAKRRGLVAEQITILRRRLVAENRSTEVRIAETAKDLLALGRPDHAERLFEGCSEETISSPEVNQQVAQLAYVRGRWQESIAAYVREAEALDRRTVDGWLGSLGVRFISGAHIGHIGHLGCIDLLQRARYLGWLSPQPRVVVARTDSVANRAYLDCWKPHLDIFYLDLDEFRAFERLMSPLFDPVSVVKLGDQYFDFYKAYAMVNSRWQEESRGPLLTLDEQISHVARATFERHGLEPGQWFVGIHVREGDPNASSNAVDADIMTYLPAIRAILRAGGAVIRIGSANMRRLPETPGVIDYATSDWKSPELDVFVWSQCRFFIGTGSGPMNPPPTFGRPLIVTNWPHFALDQGFQKHVLMPKRLLRADGSCVGFEEMMRSPFAYSISRLHHGYDWRFEENSPEDLEDAVIEMLELTSLDGSFELLAESQSERLTALESFGRTGRTPLPTSFLDKYPELFN